MTPRKKIPSEFSSPSWTQASREEAIQETIRRSALAFQEGEAAAPPSWLRFLLQQSQYIQRRWWLLQAGLLLVLWQFVQSASGQSQRAMGILAPLFVVLLLPELWKNRAAGAMEVECAAYYSLRQIYAARMLLMGLADLLLLTLFFSAALLTGGVTAEHLIVDFLLPLLVTCCICFRALCSPKSHAAYSTLPLCMVWVAVWVQIVLSDQIYPVITAPVWAALLALSLAYLGYCLCRLQKTCETIWEANPSWN